MKQNKIYAKEMRIIRNLAQWADSHEWIVKTALAAQLAFAIYYFYMYG